MKKVSFSIDRGADQPIYQQIVDQITQMVNDGLLSPGDQLPTGSELLEKYGIARGTVQYAYNKKFTSHKKIITHKKNIFKISQLKSKKTYYVRMRTYKVVRNKKVYSSWSKIKQVKIK